jgi:hypothetical protein
VFPVDRFRLDRRMWQSLKSWSHTGFVPRPGQDEVAVAASAAP